MIPVETESTNFVYTLPGEPGEGDLPCRRDLEQRLVTSWWRMETDDPPLAESYGVYVQVYDHARLIWLGVTDAAGAFILGDKRPRRATLVEKGQQTNMKLDETIREVLDGGGLFALTVSGLPSPIMSVWLA